MTPKRFPAEISAAPITVRRWRSVDADVMEDLIAASLDHLRPWMAWAEREPMGMDARRRMFERWDRYWERGHGAVYAVWDSAELVGGCALHRRDHRIVELGYWLGLHATGRGIATLAAALLTTAALDDPDTERAQISHTPSNTPSAAIARRLGYRPVSVTEQAMTWQRTRPAPLAPAAGHPD
jgi:RimJ/RimL family protein N-acetyltransferase